MSISFAEELRQDRTLVLSPTKLAAKLAMSTDELATVAGLDRYTISEHPESASVQAFMHRVVRVIAAAEEVSGDRARALEWLKQGSIAC